MTTRAFWMWMLAAYLLAVFICMWLAGTSPLHGSVDIGWAD